MRLDKCPVCQGKVRVKKIECQACKASVEADFSTSPLLNLPSSHQEFIEMFVLSSGSLKEMAQRLGISYPTVRTRLDDIIEELKTRLQERENYKKEILDKVERKEITPEEAAQIIKNL
jgi:hypothetical protein